MHRISSVLSYVFFYSGCCAWRLKMWMIRLTTHCFSSFNQSFVNERPRHRRPMKRRYPLACSWAFYAHHKSDPSTYKISYVHIMDVATCQSFGNFWNWYPIETFVNPSLACAFHAKETRAFSFFKHGSAPEWEHPSNRNGTTLTSRTKDASAAVAFWRHATLECARGRWTNVNGVVCARSMGRSGVAQYKCELWFDDHVSNVDSLEWVSTLEFTPTARA